VAGFNQFFDDINGTTSWRYGGAIDQKFTKNVFAGVEYTARVLDVPFIGPADELDHEEADEQLGRMYVFVTPHPWIALRAEFYAQLDARPVPAAQGFRKEQFVVSAAVEIARIE